MAYAYERGYGRGEKPVTGMGWGAIPARYGTRLAPQSELRGYPCGPGRTAAPGARNVGITDYVASKTTPQLGVAPAIVAGAAKAASSIVSFKKSPRYGGGDGPLISTVNQVLQQVAAGDASALQRANTARLTASRGRAQWTQFWNNELRAAVPPALWPLYTQLDPSKASQPGPTVAITPATQGVVGPTQATTGEGASSVVTDFINSFLETKAGEEAVKQYGPDVARAIAQRGQTQVGTFVGQNVVPIALGAGLLLFLALRK